MQGCGERVAVWHGAGQVPVQGEGEDHAQQWDRGAGAADMIIWSEEVLETRNVNDIFC